MTTDSIKRLLVVDDEKDIRDIYKVFLGSIGYEVLDAADGQEALEVIRDKGLPAAIIIDLDMPTMDGLSFRRNCLEIYHEKSPPTILATSRDVYHERDLAERVGSLNFSATIRKPFEWGTVIAALEQVITAHYDNQKSATPGATQ